jgi:hypothetical protein
MRKRKAQTLQAPHSLKPGVKVMIEVIVAALRFRLNHGLHLIA